MCLLSGYHLVIWERIYLSWGVWLLCFSCFRQWCTSWSWCAYSHRTFHHFQGNGLYTPKKHTQFTLGLYFGCQTPKSEANWEYHIVFAMKCGGVVDEPFIWKENNSSFDNPADIFCASSPSFPTFMSHHLPQFKNHTSSPPSLCDVKWPGYLHHFPLLCYVPWRFDTPAKQTRDPRMNQSASL